MSKEKILAQEFLESIDALIHHEHTEKQYDFEDHQSEVESDIGVAFEEEEKCSHHGEDSTDELVHEFDLVA